MLIISTFTQHNLTLITPFSSLNTTRWSFLAKYLIQISHLWLDKEILSWCLRTSLNILYSLGNKIEVDLPLKPMILPAMISQIDLEHQPCVYSSWIGLKSNQTICAFILTMGILCHSGSYCTSHGLQLSMTVEFFLPQQSS